MEYPGSKKITSAIAVWKKRRFTIVFKRRFL